MRMRKKQRSYAITVREMRVDDIPTVYRLDTGCFKPKRLRHSTAPGTLMITNNFNQDPTSLWLPSLERVGS
jgi:hypothetical protein